MQDKLPPKEADKRRDEALKRALAMPHKPHQSVRKAGKTPRGKRSG